MWVTGRDGAGAPRELADPCGEAPLPDKVLCAKPTGPGKPMPRAAPHPPGQGHRGSTRPRHELHGRPAPSQPQEAVRGGRRHPRCQTRCRGHQGRPQGGGDASRGLTGGTPRSGPGDEQSRLGHRAGDGSRVPGWLVATLQQEQAQVHVSSLPATSHVSPCPPSAPLLLTCLRRAWDPCARAGAGAAGTAASRPAAAQPRAAHPAAAPGFG